MKSNDLKLLAQILSQPTAPFREEHVLAVVERILNAGRVPNFVDPFGNLVIGAESPARYRALIREQSEEPVRLFVAHMDHPGFHGVRWLSPKRLAIKWYGGSPTRHLSGSRVWIADATGRVGIGRIAAPKLLPSRHALDTAEVRLSAPLTETTPASSLYGGFGFRAPWWRRGKRLYTKAADDLIGVYAIVRLALELRSRRGIRPPFLGLLTRAEEVGFVGAVAHFDLGWLVPARRPCIVVSLETSRALANAVIGGGPVVRLGDRRTVFDPDALRVLADVAQQVLPAGHQRRVMDGGTCEATAAMGWRHAAIGISVPLGNYHNETLDDPGSARKHKIGAPAPEYVHINDIDGLLLLCVSLMQPGLPWNDPWQLVRDQLRTRAAGYRKLLQMF